MGAYIDSPKTVAIHAYAKKHAVRVMYVSAWGILTLWLYEYLEPALTHQDTIHPLGIYVAYLYLLLLTLAPLLYQLAVFIIAMSFMPCPECGRRSMMIPIKLPPLLRHRPAVLQCRRCRHRFPTDCLEQRITCWPLKTPSFPSS